MIPEISQADLAKEEADIQLDQALAAKSFREFVTMAWRFVDPAPFVGGWHLDAIAEHLQAVADKQIDRLLLNVPPGTSKSTLTCVLFPAWLWTRDETHRQMFASYDQALSSRDAVRTRGVVNSAWYRDRWPVRLKDDQGEKTYYATTKGGYRMSTSIGAAGTGMHPNLIGIDDPHSVKRAESDTERKAVIEWYRLTLGARGAAVGIDMRMVLVMQRLHEADLSGHVLGTERDLWTQICLPMRAEPRRMVTTPLGWNDPRKPGELLDPVRFPEESVKKLERALGSYGAAGQLAQRPSPKEGGEIKREWWRYFDARFPPECNVEIQTWDTQLKDTETSAKTAALVIGRRGADLILKDGLNERMSFPELLAAVTNWKTKHSKALKKVVEDTSSGPQMESLLRRRISGIVLRKVPRASKMMRLRAVSPLNEAGNVYVPGVRIDADNWEPAYQWVAELIEQCAVGEASEFKDLADAYSQGLAELEPGVWRFEADEAEAQTAAKDAQKDPIEARRFANAAKMAELRKAATVKPAGNSRMRYMR